MLDLLLANANLPFAIALTLMLIIGLFEGVGAVLGVGLGNMLDSFVPDVSINPDIEVADAGSNSALSRLLGWLKVGKVPILMLLVVFLTAFGCIGLAMNFAASSTFGLMLPALLSVPLAFMAALPVTRWGASALEAIMPKNETSSVSLEALIGREAFVTIGQSSSVQSAEARVRDQHGQTHYVMVLAEDGHGPFGPGMPLLIVRREGNQFVVIKQDSSVLDNEK
ncbi:YqiJ family protein [Halopseudomonas salegens]|uniref:DUF1449 family protein n=1 Tax=Halopseudomonas salegens TaxID=1434072 RepID=A0A1H2GNA5_9GAMM|nr:YqiJ family protein [Halopseudomonas salegens]SDU21166.1 Protein of unknown function [Halopseudomonas salegens]